MKKLFFLCCLFFVACQHISSERRPAATINDLNEVFSPPGWVYISPTQLMNYENIWAMSDIHGRLSSLHALLSSPSFIFQPQHNPSPFIVMEDGSFHWNKAATKQLIVIVGDSIDKGEDSIGVIKLLTVLKKEAPSVGSKVVILLGNHEAEFMTSTSSKDDKQALTKNGENAYYHPWLTTKDLGPTINYDELHDTRFAKEIEQMPVGAVIGTCLFGHSGYLGKAQLTLSDDDSGTHALATYFQNLGQANFKELISEDSPYGNFIVAHNWWRKSSLLSLEKAKLNQIGISCMALGHDPDAFGKMGTLAIHDGWAIKLDSGMGDNQSQGCMMMCPVHKNEGQGNIAFDETCSQICYPNPKLQQIPKIIYHPKDTD